jgi:hypothetical protein
MFELEDLIRMYITGTLSKVARDEFEALRASGQITPEDLAEWQFIAEATRLRAERHALSVPPLPSLLPAHHNGKRTDKEQNPMNSITLTYPRTRRTPQQRLSIAWVLSVVLLVVVLMIMLNQPRNQPSGFTTLSQSTATEAPVTVQTAYDVIRDNPDLSLFRQILESAPEYLTLLQSNRPQLVLAPVDSSITNPQTLIGAEAGRAWLERLIRSGESLTDEFDAGMPLRIVGLQGGGAVVIIDAAVSIPNNAVVHIIQAGDTLLSISMNYGVSVDTLFELNPGIEQGQYPTVGQLLIIRPPNPPR